VNWTEARGAASPVVVAIIPLIPFVYLPTGNDFI
jgi:hypothetical protein